jgi:hypothetical protein
MKSLLSALVLTAASVFPVSAGIHDFNSTNAAPVPTRNRAQVGQGECFTTRDSSKVCYLKTAASTFSISILDVDYPSAPQVAHIDCKTGRWGSFGDIPKETLQWYLDDFCPQFG